MTGCLVGSEINDEVGFVCKPFPKINNVPMVCDGGRSTFGNRRGCFCDTIIQIGSRLADPTLIVPLRNNIAFNFSHDCHCSGYDRSLRLRTTHAP
mmetsp:Transcript_92997/g.129096  ORF Transcript_92997/g.129096 Transcript_92997/m.129096 type:complete len:95 (+) Transcript_92997:110-394(+)